jgi:SAM-dependent methyltransferase
VTGVELSSYASEYARSEFGLRVVVGSVESAALTGERFDVVTLWNTIEHMADPLRSLRAIAALTRPGTLLVVSTGDAGGLLARRDLARWNLMTPPHHLFFFTTKTLDELLATAGFRLRRLVYDGVIAESGQLATPRARRTAALASLGNVMTAYAVRDEAPLRGSPTRRVTARWRPLAFAIR